MINSRFREKWSEKSLSDLAVITMGQSPSSIFYNSRGEGLPLIQGNADIKSRKTIERVWTTQGNKRCDLGALILTVRAPVGTVAVASQKACIGRGVCGLKPFGDSSFLFHALVHAEDQWQALEQGSTFTAANSAQVGQFRLRVPDDENEQRAIAEVLSDVDGLLNALDALIAKKRAIKQAVMQQLLTGKTRLPSFSGAWETKRLGEIAPIRNHKTLPAYVNPATLCVELDNIEQRSGQLLEYAMARNSTSSKYHFCAGDVLFGRLRPYLRKFWHADRDGICTTEIWPLMVNRNQIDSGFLYGIVQSDAFIAAASISYGTHMPRADWNVMRNFEISLPEIQEQRAIASVLFDMDAEIAALEQRRDKTRAIKQGMMQQLLTGRVRLSESRICADDTD